MRMGNTKTTIFALHLLLIFTLVLDTTAFMKPAGKELIPRRTVAKVSCREVYGVESGDTCSSVVTKFGVDEEQFFAINPNVSCVTIFVGQWLCLSGTA